MSHPCYRCVRGTSRPEYAPTCASCYDRETGELRNFELKPPRPPLTVDYEVKPTAISCGV